MKRWPAILFLSMFALPAAADSLQCGEKVVSTGAILAEVLAKCGPPTQVDRSSMYRVAGEWAVGHLGQAASQMLEIPVEVWLYNLGPDRLMERLRFEAGELVRVEALGYGYVEEGNQRR